MQNSRLARVLNVKLNPLRGKLVQSALLLMLVHVSVRLLGMAYRVVLSRLLGAEGIGLLELAGTALAIPLALISGASPALMRRTAMHTALGDAAAARGEVRTARRVILLLGALTCLALVFFAEPIARLIGEPRVVPILYAYAPSAIFIGIGNAYTGYFYGSQRIRPPASGEIIEQCIRVSLVCALLFLMPPVALPMAAAMVAVTSVLAQMGNTLSQAKTFGRVGAGLGNTKAFLSEMAPISLTHALTSVFRSVNTAMIPILLVSAGLTQSRALSDFGTVSGMVLPFLFLPLSLTGSISTLIAPRLTARQARGERESMAQTVQTTLEAACAVGMPAMALLLFCAPLVGSLYHSPLAASLLRIMAPCTLFLCLSNTSGSLLHGLGEQKRLLIHSILQSVLTLGLNFLLIGVLRMGIEGYALTFLINTACSALLNALLLLHRARTQGRASTFLRRPLLAALPMYAIGIAWGFLLPETTVGLIAMGILSGCAYGLIYAMLLRGRNK